MPSWKNAIRKLAMNVLDMPQELVLDVAKLTLVGTELLSVENHRGVEAFGSELLRLRLPDGKLEVAGHDLTIRTIMKDEVQVEGRIERVQYLK